MENIVGQVEAGLELKPSSREGVLAVEQKMREFFPAGQNEEIFPLTHRFANGVYAREILLPKGTMGVGKIHKHGHLNVITKGRVSVLTEFGFHEYVAPFTFVSQPGTKRVFYAHEDTVWTTFHGTESTDLVQIEKDIIAESYEEFDVFARQQLENKS